MLRIMPDEYRTRLQQLKASVEKAGLDLFIVSAFDSIFYLTGAGFEPLERPFFLIIRPSGNPSLLTPMLDRDHLKLAHNISQTTFTAIGNTRPRKAAGGRTN